jgi:ribonuclease J
MLRPSFGRKVCVVGRSMEMVVEVSLNMGYSQGAPRDPHDVAISASTRLSKIVILSTGSQGEPLSALARMSVGDHRKVEIIDGDMVIMAASPVRATRPWSPESLTPVPQGPTVVYTPESMVHVSGTSQPGGAETCP